MNSIKNNNTKTRQVINFDEKVIKEALKDFSKSPCPVAAFNKFLCSLPSSTPFLSAWNKFSSCVIGDPELDFKEFLELNLDFEWKSLQIPGFHKQIFTGKCLNRGAPCFLVAVSEEDHLQIEACIHDYETDESPCEWHNQFAIAVTEGKYISLYEFNPYDEDTPEIILSGSKYVIAFGVAHRELISKCTHDECEALIGYVGGVSILAARSLPELHESDYENLPIAEFPKEIPDEFSDDFELDDHPALSQQEAMGSLISKLFEIEDLEDYEILRATTLGPEHNPLTPYNPLFDPTKAGYAGACIIQCDRIVRDKTTILNIIFAVRAIMMASDANKRTVYSGSDSNYTYFATIQEVNHFINYLIDRYPERKRTAKKAILDATIPVGGLLTYILVDFPHKTRVTFISLPTSCFKTNGGKVIMVISPLVKQILENNFGEFISANRKTRLSSK
jgi:hypothetical protein